MEGVDVDPVGGGTKRRGEGGEEKGWGWGGPTTYRGLWFRILGLDVSFGSTHII